MIPPQIAILLQLKYQASTYEQLGDLAKRQQVNPLTYLTERSIKYDLGGLENDKQVLKQTKLFFSDEFDLALTDAEKEKQGLHIYTNEALIAENPDMEILSKNFAGVKTHQAMCETLKNCQMSIWMHDFRSM